MESETQGPVFVIDGDRFDDLNGFYDEISRQFMGGIAPAFEREAGRSYVSLDPTYWGRNLDALDDILLGDMGVMPGRSRWSGEILRGLASYWGIDSTRWPQFSAVISTSRFGWSERTRRPAGSDRTMRCHGEPMLIEVEFRPESKNA